MGLLEDGIKGGGLLAGLGVAIGAVVLGPVVSPRVRPVTKRLIKAGLVAYDQGRELLAEFNERTGDIVAEARAELQEEEARHNGEDKAPASARRAAPAEARAKPPEAGGAGEPAPV